MTSLVTKHLKLRTVHTIPFTYFTCWSSSRHLNYFISEILGQRNTWFEVSAVLVYWKHQKLSNFGAKVCLTAVELQMFAYQACHVLRPVRTCFSLTCPRLDENDGRVTEFIHVFKKKREICRVVNVKNNKTFNFPGFLVSYWGLLIL